MLGQIFGQICLSLFACTAVALPFNHTDDRVEANINAGTFERPSPNVRPRYRYWLPDASVNTSFLVDDIVQLAARGAGGIEFLNYYDYGGVIATGPATDWNIYGYGTPAYRDVLKAALQVHKDLGLVMDFSMGPQSGQGVPAEPYEPGLAYNLNYFNVSLSADETFADTVPGWGTGELVSVVVFATSNTANVSTVNSKYSLFGSLSGPVNSTLHTIISSSIGDVSAQVHPDGFINVTAPAGQGALEYYLMASYYSRSYERACIASSSDPQNILQNGSFAVDHFSSVRAQLTIDFLEQYVLVDGIETLMREVGNYIWEDSVEIPSHVYWTPKLSSVFQETHGYRIEPYLPLLAGRNGALASSTSIGPHYFILDTEDAGSGIVGDWRRTMTTLLGQYYDTLVNWTNSYLDLQFSAQIGYNLPTDMLSNIARVNAPETESLSFINNIDSFRQYVGPANLAGKRVISMELGSDFLETYTQTWTALLKDAKRAFVTGVNQVVIHGATYSHTYPNTTWPGFTSFGYAFAAQHSRHQPAWDIGYGEAGEYLARTQFILQSGIPKVDLMFWDKRTAERPYPETLYWPGDLTAKGYTYSYLSPDNLVQEQAVVADRVLAPGAQAFRALIIRANDTLTVDGIQKLAQYARAGLPIIVSGGVPGSQDLSRQPVVPFYTSGEIPAAWDTNNSSGILEANNTLQSILELPNVHQVPYDSLAESVAAIGIAPRTIVDTHDGVWITHWREASNGDTFVFVYNEGNSSTGSISFETTSSPTFLDAWSGEEIPVVAYRSNSTHTTMDFSLAYSETAIIKFTRSAVTQNLHVVAAPVGALVNSYAATDVGAGARVIAINATEEGIKLSNGTVISFPPSIAAATNLTDWALTIEQWNPPDDLFDVEIVANKSNVTLNIQSPELKPWYLIDESLTNVSGIGYYSTKFSWPPQSGSASGAVLTLPPISHGITVTVNGQVLPSIDITHPIADLSAFLVEGENSLSINVASTLWNVLTPIWDQLRTGNGRRLVESLGGYSALGFGGVQPYGIVGNVQLVPYVLLAL
ncbi:hypothetical protein LTS08_007710 [Lithohypha guttulata]|nr:hypothetical protein LTS08_007710 [Lithohypha guttulata]